MRRSGCRGRPELFQISFITHTLNTQPKLKTLYEAGTTFLTLNCKPCSPKPLIVSKPELPTHTPSVPPRTRLSTLNIESLHPKSRYPLEFKGRPLPTPSSICAHCFKSARLSAIVASNVTFAPLSSPTSTVIDTGGDSVGDRDKNRLRSEGSNYDNLCKSPEHDTS